MNVKSVSSTNVAGIGYDDTSATLEVHFTSGAIYQYFNVPRYTYDAFMNSSSKGQYLNQHIKNAYRYMRL